MVEVIFEAVRELQEKFGKFSILLVEQRGAGGFGTVQSRLYPGVRQNLHEWRPGTIDGELGRTARVPRRLTTIAISIASRFFPRAWPTG